MFTRLTVYINMFYISVGIGGEFDTFERGGGLCGDVVLVRGGV